VRGKGVSARLAGVRLTTAALVFVFVVVLVAVLGTALPARAQFFSPGPLAKAHASLDGKGLDKCGACHNQAESGFAKRCLACHNELGPEIKQQTGLHGRMAPAVLDQCQSCHPDHRGRDFFLINFGGPLKGFDHKKTGWALRGHHAQTSCESCHAKRQLVDVSVVRMLDAQPGRTTYLGLAKRCDSCHFDEHRGQLGKDCQSCHGEQALSWARGYTSFDHTKTDFPLRGKHKPVACTDCHAKVEDRASLKQMFPPPRDVSFLQMKPVAHGTCENCHRDPHKGSFGPNCAACHTEEGWGVILSGRNLGPSFHDNTRFPLRGAHATVNCKSCHGPFSQRQPAVFRGLPFAKCADCHQDAHVGQLAALPSRPAADCAACHDVNGFAPPRFELEAHAKTSFPLEGGHAVAACRDCHPVDKSLASRVPDTVRAKLSKQHRPVTLSLAVLRPKIAAEQCSRCHQDPHQGQFAAEIQKNDCGDCHTVRSFNDVTFDHDSDSRFPLTGAHARTPCASCHRVETVRAGEPAVTRWKPLPIACGSCHRDEHQGQFLASTKPAAGPRRAAEACDFCHQTESFKKTQFNHADPRFTTFALEGKHAALPCADCHRPITLAARQSTVRTIRYRPVPRSCEGCHVDFHHGDFRGFEP
jgi:hypothetical protein